MQAHPLNVPISNIITYRFGFMQRNTTGKIVSHILIYPEIITNKNNYSPKFTYTIFVKNSNILLQHLSSKKHNLNSKPNLISPAKSGREVLGAPAKKFSSRRNGPKNETNSKRKELFKILLDSLRGHNNGVHLRKHHCLQHVAYMFESL